MQFVTNVIDTLPCEENMTGLTPEQLQEIINMMDEQLNINYSGGGNSGMPIMISSVSSEIIESLGGKKVEDLTEAVKSMDAISLHMPLNEKTKNIINYDLLKTMRKNCIIINAARGGMINENDLDKALNESLIFGAGLDVFETEPPKEDNPLLKNNKVFLSPHTAAFTEECMIRMGKETIQNIIDFFEKKLDKSKIIKL